MKFRTCSSIIKHHIANLTAGDRHRRRSSAFITLGGHDLVVVGAKSLQGEEVISLLSNYSRMVSSDPLTIPRLLQAAMWLAKVMVPLVRSLVRMDRYWLKVAVP